MSSNAEIFVQIAEHILRQAKGIKKDERNIMGIDYKVDANGCKLEVNFID